MKRALLALPAGFLAGLAILGLPASAANQSIAAGAGIGWNPDEVTIAPGEQVTWSNAQGGFHNVCVAKADADVTTCSAANNEFRNGDVATDWSGYTNAHTFTTAGEYKFLCEQHGTSMQGRVHVTAGGGTTTTQTSTTQTSTTQTSTTQTTTTQTQTTTTQTGTNTVPSEDTTVPRFVGKPKRRASRKALIVEFRSSEAGDVETTVSRRAPRARSFRRVGRGTAAMKQGRNVLRLSRRVAGSVRKGAYRIRLVLIDDAGNRSAPRTINFKIA
jgi:plastocyanin